MKKWKLGLTASLLSMLLLAGCGSDSDSDNGGASDTEKTFQIGYTQSLSMLH